jgi:hypothetical protein
LASLCWRRWRRNSHASKSFLASFWPVFSRDLFPRSLQNDHFFDANVPTTRTSAASGCGFCGRHRYSSPRAHLGSSLCSGCNGRGHCPEGLNLALFWLQRARTLLCCNCPAGAQRGGEGAPIHAFNERDLRVQRHSRRHVHGHREL